MKQPNWNADDKNLCIRNGTLICGIFNKELVGQGAGVNYQFKLLEVGRTSLLA